MRNLKLSMCTCFMLFLPFYPFFCNSALGIVNYDNHPDLLKAMEFDGGTNGADMEKADRSKAEYYYLRYLEDVNESFQKAAVYERLGELYSVGYNLTKGEKRDREKARDYYEKLLECEPERIGRNTIVARNMLCTMGKPSGIEWVKARIDMYNWLSQIDEKKIKENFLPKRPPIIKYPDPNSTSGADNQEPQIIYPRDSNEPSAQSLALLRSLIEGLKETAVYNASYDAMYSENPEEAFIYIFENLPPDAPERKTAERIYKKISVKSVQ